MFTDRVVSSKRTHTSHELLSRRSRHQRDWVQTPSGVSLEGTVVTKTSSSIVLARLVLGENRLEVISQGVCYLSCVLYGRPLNLDPLSSIFFQCEVNQQVVSSSWRCSEAPLSNRHYRLKT